MADKFTFIEGLDRPAARAIPAVRRAWDAAVRALREGYVDPVTGVKVPPVSEAVILKMLDTGSVAPLLETDAWGVYLRILGDVFLPTGPLGDLVVATARGAAAEAPLAGLALDLPRLDAVARQWVQEHGAGRVVRISDRTRAGVQKILDRAIAGPTSRREAARAIAKLPGLGLEPDGAVKFTKWVERKMASASDPRGAWFDYSQKQIQHRINVEHGRRVRQRGRLIAHTESYDFGNAGRRIAYEEALSQGKISAETYVLQWVTRVINVCPRCQALAYSWCEIQGGLFVSRPVASGRYQGQVLSIGRPTVHPSCYCSIRTVRRADAIAQAAAVVAQAALLRSFRVTSFARNPR